MGEDGKKRKPKVKIGYKICRYAESENSEVNNFSRKSVLPRILVKLLKARKDTRKIMTYKKNYMKDGSIVEGITEELEDGRIEVIHLELGKRYIQKDDVEKSEDSYSYFEKKVLDGLQLAYKVTCNSLYGQVGATTSPICFKELAACTTATGRKMVITARDVTLATYEGTKLTYGDSVTGDTPILLRRNGEIYVKNIKDLGKIDNWKNTNHFKPNEEGLRDKEENIYESEIWTANGWTSIRRVIRHKTNKKIYRVLTNRGLVDVTEDHSLLSPNLDELKPKDVEIGCELRHIKLRYYHLI